MKQEDNRLYLTEEQAHLRASLLREKGDLNIKAEETEKGWVISRPGPHGSKQYLQRSRWRPA